MFLKINEIKIIVVDIANLTKDEYEFINRNLSDYKIIYLIPYNEEEPSFLTDKDIFIKEDWSDGFFSYERIIKQIVNTVQFPSENIVIISKNNQQLKLASSEPIGTILISSGDISYNDIGYLPDLKLNSLDELEKINNKMGYFSEVSTTILGSSKSFNTSGFVFTFQMQREGIEFDVVAGGRYFNSKHECFNSHQLSHRINKSKHDNSQNNLFEGLFIPIVNLIKQSSSVHGITRVPNRPSKPDRLKPL